MTFPSVDVTGKRVFLCRDKFTGFRECRQVDPTKERERPFGKPRGLFYSVGDEWVEWCKSEMPKWLDDYRFMYEVVLVEDRVMRITTADALKSFDVEYGIGRSSAAAFFGEVVPDWRRVAQTHGGIEIAPYQYSHRFNMTWYYGWDVASGCVWSKGAVADVRLLESR